MNWALLQNTAVVGLCTTGLALLAGTVAGVAAATARGWGRTAWCAGAISVFALPPFLVTNTWLHFFGLAGVWKGLVPFEIYSLPGTVLVLILQLWPIPFLFVLGQLGRIDPVYLEHEPLLKGMALWRYLLWPVCRPAMVQSGLLVFVLSINNFAVPALLQIKVFSAEAWLSFNTRFDYLQALRLSCPLVLGPILLMLFFRTRPVRYSFKNPGFPRQLFRERIGSPIIFVFSVLSALVLCLSLGLPLVQLIGSSRAWLELFPALAAGQNAFVNSFLFATGTALSTAIIGVFLRHSRWLAVSWILFLVPGILLGMGLICVFNRPATSIFYQSIGIVILAYTLRFLAPAWSGARVGLHRADRSLLDVTRLFGANGWRQFLLAEWPFSRGAILATSYVVFLLCLWDVETLIFIVPPGRETLALRIFNMLHYGHASQVDALCLWLLALAVLPLIIYACLRRIFGAKNSLILLLPFLAIGCGKTSNAIQTDLFSDVEVFGSRGNGAGQFNKPRSLAVDKNNNFYVVDLTGRVQKFSARGEYLLSWQMPETDKGKPKGMIADYEGNIVVIEPHYSRVNHFSPKGVLVFQWGNHGTNNGQLVFPRAVAFTSKSDIYLSEYGMFERVQRFSARGEKFLGAFGRPGTGNGDFNRPEGLGMSPDDRLYVADSCNHRVQIFTTAGEFISTFGTAGSGPGQMSYPYDVRIDSEGTVFVCEFGNSRIQIFDRDHQPIGQVGGPGTAKGQLNNPWSIDLDPAGNLYVADSGNHRVQKFVRKKPLSSSNSNRLSLAK